MTKDIKDYLHYYIGCEAAISYDPKGIAGILIDTITGVSLNGVNTSNGYLEKFEAVKPILRPLSSMTNKEVLTSFHLSYEDAKYQFEEFDKIETNEFGWRAKNQNGMQCFLPANSFKPDVFHYLLKQGFDLFGLIESGLAIDATTLNESK